MEMILLEALLESEKKEKILFYLYSHREGYAREIARTFRFNLNTVQNQLKKLESHGILCSQLKGKVRIFSFDPRYPFGDELEALLKKAIMYLPEEDVRKYYWPHTKPQHTEISPKEHAIQRGISFAFANPWENSHLDRFRPSQISFKKTSRVDPEISRKK
jgi:DNA-binding transcriptional ArsR family regulator